MERSQSLTHLGIPCEARVSSRPRRVRVRPACRPLYLSRVGRTPATPAHGRTDMSHDARKCHNPTNLQVQLHPPRPARSPRGPVVSAVDDLDHRSPHLQLHLHTPTSTNHEPAQTPRLDQDSTPVSYRLVRHAVSQSPDTRVSTRVEPTTNPRNGSLERK